LNTVLTPHSIIHGDACFAYFNKIWGIPRRPMSKVYKKPARANKRKNHSKKRIPPNL
jgi:hypothetical protein